MILGLFMNIQYFSPVNPISQVVIGMVDNIEKPQVEQSTREVSRMVVRTAYITLCMLKVVLSYWEVNANQLSNGAGHLLIRRRC